MKLFKLKLSLSFFIILAGVLGISPESSEAVMIKGVEIKPQGSLSEAFDDNVTFANANERSDFITNLLLGIRMDYQGRTEAFNISGSLKQQIFAKESDFNNISQKMDASYQKELDKYNRITINNRFNRQENPSSFEDDFGRRSGRYAYYRNSFDIEYERNFSKRVTAKGRYGNQLFGASDNSITNSFENNVGFEFNFIQSSSTYYLLGYDFYIRNYDSAGSLMVNAFSGGVKHFLTKQLYLLARAGVSIVESVNGDSSAQPDIFVSLVDDLSETNTVSLTYEKRNLPSSFSADIFDSWRVSLGLRRRLLARMRMNLSVFLGEGDFKTLGTSDTQTGVKSQLNYDLSKNTVSFLSYTFAEVNSNISSRDYKRNLVELGVKVLF